MVSYDVGPSQPEIEGPRVFDMPLMPNDEAEIDLIPERPADPMDETLRRRILANMQHVHRMQRARARERQLGREWQLERERLAAGHDNNNNNIPVVTGGEEPARHFIVVDESFEDETANDNEN